jgi:hypothetical protein
MEFMEALPSTVILSEYLGDEDYRALQVELVTNPEMGRRNAEYRRISQAPLG